MSAVRWRALAAAVLLTAVTAVAGVSTAQHRAGADTLLSTGPDPTYAAWPELLPGLSDRYDPRSSNVCVSGQPTCIDAMVREMERRYEPLVDSCSHQALFALTYLRVTQTYAWSARQPDYYPDVHWLNHAVAVFAKYYLGAYDAWTADNDSPAVPPAWRIAFDNARDGKVSGSGNFLLGLNAHINRDLAYAMDAAGLTDPDGASEKQSFDRVNELLNSVSVPLVAELAARLDGTVDDSRLPFYLDAVAIGNVMFSWREQAWRNAELLAGSTALTRPAVVASIENNSIAQANAHATAQAYTSAQQRADRDDFCAAHHADPAPQPYPFGTPTR